MPNVVCISAAPLAVGAACVGGTVSAAPPTTGEHGRETLGRAPIGITPHTKPTQKEFSMRMFRIRAAIAAAALATSLPAAATPPSFTFTNINVPNAADTYVFGFIAGGGLVGSFFDASNTLHGFIQNKAGTFTQVDLKGIKGLAGSAIQAKTAAGTLAQAYVNTSAGQVVATYFIDNTGKYTQIALPKAKSTYGWAMNKAGTIVGSYVSADGSTTSAFIYQGGKYTTFSEKGMSYTSYNGINDKGVIVGDYQAQPGQDTEVGFILNAGKMKLVEYPNVTATTLQGINNAGEVVGYVRDYYNRSNTGFVYKSGVFTDVGVGVPDYVWAWAIDTKGNIAGADVLQYEAVSGFVGTLN